MKEALKVDELASGLLEVRDACGAIAARFDRSKPIYGGVFGDGGEFAIASCSCLSAGLHASLYAVIHRATGVFACRALHDKKQEAIADARGLLGSIDRRAYMAALSIVGARLAERARKESEERRKATNVHPKKKRAAPAVSRRRKQVFDSSGGRCFYCDCDLALDGKWHVEHKIPRALDGTNDRSNLAAACVPCNLQKGDKTAEEFIALRMERSGLLRSAA